MTTRCHTFTGSGFDPFGPRSEDVRIEDIAHHLSMICRYGGAIPTYYSVAQHAIRVARVVLQETGNPEWALFALHHDDAEAYIHDIRRPIKQRLYYANGLYHDDDETAICQPFGDLEDDVLGAIWNALFTREQAIEECKAREVIQHADNAVLRAEMRCLFKEAEPDVPESPFVAPILRLEQCMDWYSAKGLFLSAHRTLTRDVRAAAENRGA